MKLKFFDIETLPGWWCVVVSDEEDSYASSPYNYQFTKEEELKIKSKMRVYTSDGGVEEMKRYLADTSKGVLSGYNSKRFDMVIQKCISLHFTPRQIYIAAQIIIDKDNYPEELNVTATEIARIGNYVRGWTAKWQGAEATQDLMDDSTKGLKDKEASYGMDIRESEIPFDKIDLTEADKLELIDYCKHDVYALHVHYACVAKPYIDTKLSLGRTYDIPAKVCYESTNAVLSGRVLGAERYPGTTIKDPTITIYQPLLREYIEKWVPQEALQHLYTNQSAKNMTMFENRVYMADGGIHSTLTTPKDGRKNTNLYIEADDEYGLFNVDLSGCHPSVMIWAGSMPRGIKRPERFKESVLRRRALKAVPKHLWTDEDRDFVPAGKLIHNTTYGAAGNKYLPLYDDYMRSKVCRVSQMIIIAVAMSLYTQIPGLRVIQTNTDGILVYMKREYLDILQSLVKEFEDLSEFAFELEEFDKIWQLNVNNYIAIDSEKPERPIVKGQTFVQSIYQIGYNQVRTLSNHIIAKAHVQYYVNGVNPVQYVIDETLVNDFVLTAFKGPTYYGMIHETANGDIPLGRVARVIAVEDTTLGQVRKLKHNANGIARDLVASCPPHALIVNDALENYVISGDVHDKSITHIPTGNSWKIDLSYYAGQLNRVLDIPWVELHKEKINFITKFNLGGVGSAC